MFRKHWLWVIFALNDRGESYIVETFYTRRDTGIWLAKNWDKYDNLNIIKVTGR